MKHKEFDSEQHLAFYIDQMLQADEETRFRLMQSAESRYSYTFAWDGETLTVVQHSTGKGMKVKRKQQ